MNKPIICLDFDGVIHSYENGWQGGEIYGTATPGFFAWLLKALDHFEIVIYSSRSKTPEGLTAMREAIGKWSIDAIESGEIPRDTDWGAVFPRLDFSDVKPPAFLTIDDRAICFQGDWKALDPAELTEFRTWTQRDRSSAPAEMVDDWNRMVGTIAEFSDKWSVRKPDVVFHPEVQSVMARASRQRFLNTLIYMGVRIRFGQFEQADVLRS